MTKTLAQELNSLGPMTTHSHSLLAARTKTLAFASLVTLLVIFSSSAFGSTKPIEADNRTFIDVASERFEELSRMPLRAHEVKPGETAFLPLELLVRGQDQISVDNIKAKALEHQELGNLTHDRRWILGHDDGRSVVPSNDPIQVIKGRQGYVIVDGHHDAYLSLFLGARTIAVHVQEDLSHLSKVAFWAALKKRKLVLLSASPESLARKAPGFRSVTDNPNRFLAALVALKVSVDEKSGAILKIKGAKDPAWIKVNNGIPFIEFEIAEKLSNAGIEYDPKWGSSVPADVVERVRSVFLHTSDPGLLALPAVSTAEEGRLLRDEPARLSALLRSHSCQTFF